MKLFDWFKPENKKNVVLPTDVPGALRGAELIKAFTTDDEPKCRDFPKEKFTVYWEIFVDAIPGGYGAIVNFNSFDNTFRKTHQIQKKTIADLRQEVSKLILQTMASHKR